MQHCLCLARFGIECSIQLWTHPFEHLFPLKLAIQNSPTSAGWAVVHSRWTHAQSLWMPKSCSSDWLDILSWMLLACFLVLLFFNCYRLLTLRVTPSMLLLSSMHALWRYACIHSDSYRRSQFLGIECTVRKLRVCFCCLHNLHLCVLLWRANINSEAELFELCIDLNSCVVVVVQTILAAFCHYYFCFWSNLNLSALLSKVVFYFHC